MPELTPAPSINDARTQALLVLVERLGALDLTPLLVYRLDSVPDGALPLLAWQFDLLSPLWQLVAPLVLSVDALTDIDALIDIDTLAEPAGIATALADAAAAERALLGMAIPLHRSRGTPWAIKHALASLGWPNVTLLEGQRTWGGTQYPASQGWAVFRVLISLAPDDTVATGAAATIVAAVNFFKPARSLLDSVRFVIALDTDAAPAPLDVLTLGGIARYELDSAPVPADGAFQATIHAAPLADTRSPILPLYNSHYRHSGITYDANEPMVADPALILNGSAVLHGG